MRKLRRTGVGAVPFLVFLFLTGPSSVFAGCYQTNLGAWHDYPYAAPYIGAQATVDLFAATPNDHSSTIVHPLQIGGSSGSGDFIGWGTAIGEGVSQCPDYFGANWQVYVDGASFGTYFCHQPFGSLASNASGQVFKMQFEPCPSNPQFSQWAMFLNGVFKVCQGIDSTSANRVVAGGESITSGGDQVIDVRYRSDKYLKGSTWSAWGAGDSCTNSPYKIQLNSNSDFKAWKS
ncbi:MAG TPA: hypothetical protein VFI15_02120 [Candidatus Limnocylindrales bacterium]|nr:hypothetical protein [Candidatus Limnocylindrales bacterium]